MLFFHAENGIQIAGNAACRSVNVWRMIVPDVWAKRLDPPQLDVADNGTAFRGLEIIIENLGDEIVRCTVKRLQVHAETLNPLGITSIPEVNIQDSLARFEWLDMADTNRATVGNTSFTGISGDHLPAVPAVGLYAE